VLRLRHKSPHDSKRHAPDEGHDKEAACAAKRLRDQAEECGAHRSADSIRASDIHFGRSCGAPDHQGFTQPPRVLLQALWKNHSLLIFAGCLFLFQLVNASILPLMAGTLGHSEASSSALVLSALVIVPQILVALWAPWMGRQAKAWGRRPLLLIGFGALPIRALLFSVITDPVLLVGVQLLDGVSGTVLGVPQALVIADLTRGTGRFNLAQGLVGAVSARDSEQRRKHEQGGREEDIAVRQVIPEHTEKIPLRSGCRSN
jgi:hypothetical protein